jgi:MFS family permease
MAITASQSTWNEGRKVILASSLGSAIEFYDFYLYGSLAGNIARQFFSALDPTAGFIFALLAFAAGFIVRPFGALIFGRLGDMIGRKYTFLITVVLIGASTFFVGVLPSYATLGITAPIILISLRFLQGLALGGEYGGAATFVAEHAPDGKRGEYTAWIQTTATVGLLMSLIVIGGLRAVLDSSAFDAWGWRIPFLLSVVLVAVSAYIRLSMQESPIFTKMKHHGEISKAPISEALGEWRNLRKVLLALFGLCPGIAVVWYTSQFYALFFLTKILQVNMAHASLLVGVSLLLGMPLFVLFGAISDRIGRKWIMMLGFALSIFTYIPLFHALTHYANPSLEAAYKNSSIVVRVDPATCSFQGSPIAREADFYSSCDIAKRLLAQSAVSYSVEAAPPGTIATIAVGPTMLPSFEASLTPDKQSFDAPSQEKLRQLHVELTKALRDAKYPARADPASINGPMVILVLFILQAYVAVTYGPFAAYLVEMFPARLRYTSTSVPYHIGSGWFGGLLPTIAFALVAQNGNIYSGLLYPIVIAAITLVIGSLFLRSTQSSRFED